MKDFTQSWKTTANSKSLRSIHFVFRAALLALQSKNPNKEEMFIGLLDRYFTPSKHDRYKTLEKLVDIAISVVKFTTVETSFFGEKILESEEEATQFLDILKSFSSTKNNLGRKFVYYFTAQDMSAEQQGVQAAHAVFKLGAILKAQQVEFNPDETYFQWIGVADENELKSVMSKHSKQKYVNFVEPDIGNKVTSVAFYPVPWYKRSEFREYDLLTH